MPTTDRLQTGQLVRLISGGPLMTVGADRADGDDRHVWCEWFAGDEHKIEEFPRGAIRPTPADDVLNEVARQIWERAQETMQWVQRCDAAVTLAYKHTGDAPHHMAWLVDQMVRALLGNEIAYKAFVGRFAQEHPGEEWDPGVAP